MKYISSISVLCLSVLSFAAHALPDKLQAIEFLEAKTAYCYSQDSLTQYLDYALMNDIDSMNQLVLKGACDFVPDGQVYSLTDYEKSRIGSTAVIAFNKDDKTLWTFKVFVNQVEM